MLFNRTITTEPYTNVELYGQTLKLNISNIFGKSSIVNHDRKGAFHLVNNGHISGSKNNYLWQSIKNVFNQGYLIVLLGLGEEQLSRINSRLSILTKCRDEEICKSNQRCLNKQHKSITDGCRSTVRQFNLYMLHVYISLMLT